MLHTPEHVFVASKMAQADFYWSTRFLFKSIHNIPFQQAGHHQAVCAALMRVFNGETKRLIINIPPRYGKTSLAITYFVPWALGIFPDCEFMLTSYSGTLAAGNSLLAREVLLSDAYAQIFPNARPRTDRGAANDWQTTAGGRIYAAGCEGTLTGMGAGKKRDGFGGALIIDDPHKPLEALSEPSRKKTIEWFQGTVETRLNSANTPIIVIMQRLHEEDLAGWLIAGGSGEKWETVILPAIQIDGTALWSQMHSIEKLRQLEEAAPYVFAGQYMQAPAPAGGGLFKPSKMPILESLAELQGVGVSIVRKVRGWDLAGTDDAGDYTAGGAIYEVSGMPYRYVIADIKRIRGGPEKVEALLKETAKSDGPRVRISIPQDPGQAGKSQVRYLTNSLSGYPVSSSLESGSKEDRAGPLAAQMNVGNVAMLRGEWNLPLMNELANFPNGKYKDQVDSLSRAFSELTMGGGSAKFIPLEM